MNKAQKGASALFAAYFLWGAMPLYWKMLEHISSFEILCHRVVWSALFTAILLATRRQVRYAVDFVRREPKKALTLCAGGFMIAFNWGMYIWGINHGHVLECSLGYYINPLVSMFLGLVFFREKMDRLQTAALLLAAAGVTVELIAVRSIPMLSLGLALTFGLYGALKKAIPIDSSASLCIETISVTPAALVCLFWLQHAGYAAFPYDPLTFLLLAGAGITTAFPLILFAYGAKNVRMTTMGFIQYTSPTLLFILGTFLYNEPLRQSRVLTFVFIWAALAVYGYDTIKKERIRLQ